MRWKEWVSGRRYVVARFQAHPEARPGPLATIAHSFSDTSTAEHIAQAIEQDWPAVPTQCREAYDEILFRAVSPGGTSLASDRDFIAADTADEIIAQGGLGKFTLVECPGNSQGRGNADADECPGHSQR